MILATPLIEKLHSFYHTAKIDFLLRKGNESILANNPHLNDVLVWDKKKGKYPNLFSMLKKIREGRYDLVICVQRFFSSGLLAAFSNAGMIIGFDKNPLSLFFTRKIRHVIGSKENPVHEVDRNLSLIRELTDDCFVKPRIYPSKQDFNSAKATGSYVCIAPTSVWFTKQLPPKKWTELINRFDEHTSVYLIGGKEDYEACEEIKDAASNKKVINLAGVLSLLKSAALMKGAQMNYVNDSAPQHLASAVNAPVTAVYCSTVPEFGFTPLSDQSKIAEIKIKLDCRPCGLHGYAKCPKGHFKCADIEVAEII